MSEPQHVEVRRLARSSYFERGRPLVQPGSREESDALDRIDELRDKDLDRINDTQQARARRARRYWSGRI